MPTIDLTPYYQPQGSTSDGTKYDNGLALIQSTLNAVDNNNIATNAAIAASKLAGIATVLGTQNVGAANTDLQGPGASRSDLYVVTTGTGTVRSIAAPTENGSRVVIRNASGSSITLKHQLVGGTGAQLYLRTLADVTLLDKELVEFVYDGTNWVEIGRDQAGAAGSSAVTYRKTTAKAVNTTVAATDLLNGEITLAAGVLGTTGKLHATIWGDFLNNSGGAVVGPRFQVALGATTVLDTGTGGGTHNASATRAGWVMDIDALELGATNSQVWRIKFTMHNNAGLAANGSTAFTTGEGVYGAAVFTSFVGFGAVADGINTSAVDMTLSQVLSLSVINGSANALYETKLLGATVEIV